MRDVSKLQSGGMLPTVHAKQLQGIVARILSIYFLLVLYIVLLLVNVSWILEKPELKY